MDRHFEVAFETWFLQSIMTHNLSANDILWKTGYGALITGGLHILGCRHNDHPLVEPSARYPRAQVFHPCVTATLSLLDVCRKNAATNKHNDCLKFLTKYLETQSQSTTLEE